MAQIQWYKVIDNENLDPSFSRVAILDEDVYFAIECFNLNRAEAISVILTLNGEGFIHNSNIHGELSGVYISSKTMNKAFKEKNFSQQEIDDFNKIVKGIKEQCKLAQVMKNMKSSSLPLN